MLDVDQHDRRELQDLLGILALLGRMPCLFLPVSRVHGNQYRLGTLLILRLQVHPLQKLKVTHNEYRNIRIFGYSVVLNLVLRVAMYVASGVIMQGKVPSYASIDPK